MSFLTVPARSPEKTCLCNWRTNEPSYKTKAAAPATALPRQSQSHLTAIPTISLGPMNPCVNGFPSGPKIPTMPLAYPI